MKEALCALKRRISDPVYRQLVLDAEPDKAGPGGHSGSTVVLKGGARCPHRMTGYPMVRWEGVGSVAPTSNTATRTNTGHVAGFILLNWASYRLRYRPGQPLQG